MNDNTSNKSTVKSVSTTTVIREVYDGVNSQERFEYELECALEAKSDYIVIEPTKLGELLYEYIEMNKYSIITASFLILIQSIANQNIKKMQQPFSL